MILTNIYWEKFETEINVNLHEILQGLYRRFSVSINTYFIFKLIEINVFLSLSFQVLLQDIQILSGYET